MIFVNVKKKFEKHPSKKKFVWKKSLASPKRWSGMVFATWQLLTVQLLHVALTWHVT